MTATDRPLHELCAGDLMSRELVLIPDDISLQDAARRLVRNQVSGAPVVDCCGKLVGVISSSIFKWLSFCKLQAVMSYKINFEFSKLTPKEN